MEIYCIDSVNKRRTTKNFSIVWKIQVRWPPKRKSTEKNPIVVLLAVWVLISEFPKLIAAKCPAANREHSKLHHFTCVWVRILFTFHTGCLIGVLIMTYYNPHITGWYNPLYTLNNQGFFHCSGVNNPRAWPDLHLNLRNSLATAIIAQGPTFLVPIL